MEHRIERFRILRHRLDEHYSVIDCRGTWDGIPVFVKVGVVSRHHPVSFRNLYELQYYTTILSHRDLYRAQCPFIMYPYHIDAIPVGDVPWPRLRKYISKHFADKAGGIHADMFCTFIVTEYVHTISLRGGSGEHLLLQMSIQVMYAIRFMVHQLEISHNDLHMGNILVSRSETPWVWVDETSGRTFTFDIRCRVFDFDSATSRRLPNPLATLPVLQEFDTTGKRDWVKYVCWVYDHYRSPRATLYLDSTFKRGTARGRALIEEIVREQHRSGRNCFFEIGNNRTLLMDDYMRYGVHDIDKILRYMIHAYV